MTLQTFSELHGWKLADGDQDIRQRPLLNASGRQLGVIKDLIADTENERIKAVVTDGGEAYAVEGLEIRSDSVVAHDPPVSGGTSEPVSMRPAGSDPYRPGLVRGE